MSTEPIQPAGLGAAIAKVRASSITVVKTARNTGLNSDYASYVDIWAALHPELTAAGLAVGFLPKTIRKEGDAWVQSITMEVSNAADSLSFTFEVIMPERNRGTNITQCQGMSQTYGRRYALVAFFHIITGDDDDAQRLGRDLTTDEAPRASNDAHWSQFCFVPLFGVGSLETQGTWATLADPESTDGRILGDNSPQILAKIWMRHPNHVGINAWRAELIQERATKQNAADWAEIRSAFKSLHLPEVFTECTGDHLANLALGLAPKAPTEPKQ